MHFVFFLPLVVAFYYMIPYRFRWIMLLGASYYFYMCWRVEYIFLIIASTLVDYFAGIQMSKTSDKSKRKKYLIMSLCTNLGLLFSFKYFNFFNESLRAAFHHFNILYDVPYFNVLLPVGISFYTFQTLSYTIYVYQGKQEPERHLGIFALYVAFFPQLVAGPIERSSRLLPQFYQKNDFNYDRAVDGLKQIMWGFFKKLVVADRAGVYVNAVFNNQEHHSGITLAAATIFFAFQVYGDFAGYSDIAIGSAKMMGYDLMTNFRTPYFSRSIGEFWIRWHISLSTWFRDFLYIPLGGNRVGKLRRHFNIFTTFTLSGLWHGADWTFVIWGSLHGVYMMCSIATVGVRERLRKILRLHKIIRWPDFTSMIITFTLFNFALMIFRANSVGDAVQITGKVLRMTGPLYIGTGDDVVAPVYAVIAILILLFIEVKNDYFPNRLLLFSNRHRMIRHLSYAALVMLILLLGVFDGSQFIYFQF
jgi:alginate O-acetyltransferase complex protein AlgI